jgi:hypothetical protein
MCEEAGEEGAALVHRIVGEMTDDSVPTTGSELMNRYHIGRHLSKEGAFAQSLQVVPDGSRAWQYFLSSPRMTKVSVKAEDTEPKDFRSKMENKSEKSSSKKIPKTKEDDDEENTADFFKNLRNKLDEED